MTLTTMVDEDKRGNVTTTRREYLKHVMSSPHLYGRARNIFIAHEKSTRGFVSGEVKLALTLRILGGIDQIME